MAGKKKLTFLEKRIEDRKKHGSPITKEHSAVFVTDYLRRQDQKGKVPRKKLLKSQQKRTLLKRP